MRLLAIGDTHGCVRAFDTLLTLVAPQSDDWLITLGDYVDRGPDSSGMIQRLVDRSQQGRLIALRGNHEEMMLDARTDPMTFNLWLQYGGDSTLASYGVESGPAWKRAIPDEHWRFLEEVCVDWFEAERHFFVHATADPKRPLSDQSATMLRWQKFNDPPPHGSGKIMICGHTYQESGWPRNIGHAVCIDTWVYGDGWLTCLDVGSGEFWQANQQGETRTANLRDHLVQPKSRGRS